MNEFVYYRSNQQIAFFKGHCTILHGCNMNITAQVSEDSSQFASQQSFQCCTVQFELCGEGGEVLP
jgi:hypothetical protein